MTKQSRAKRIADLNDKFRKSLVTGGRTYMTAGVNTKGPEFVSKALAKVIAFDDFNADNDPHGEHDFGSFDLEGEKLFWKIDLYERRPVKVESIENNLAPVRQPPEHGESDTVL
jgi:hypothetical protein